MQDRLQGPDGTPGAGSFSQGMFDFAAVNQALQDISVGHL
jgi:hypothetical protein